MCRLMYVFSWTNMANLLEYLGNTVREKTIMADAKEIAELTRNTTECVCAKAEGMAHKSLIHLFQTCHSPPYIQCE